METWTIKGFLYVSQPYGNHYVNLRSTLKNFLPKSEGDWNQQVDILVHLFEMTTWVHKISVAAAKKRLADHQYIPLASIQCFSKSCQLCFSYLTQWRWNRAARTICRDDP